MIIIKKGKTLNLEHLVLNEMLGHTSVVKTMEYIKFALQEPLLNDVYEPSAPSDNGPTFN